MLGPFKWLFYLALCACCMVLLPIALICILKHWIAYVIAAIPVLFIALREDRRKTRAKMSPYRFKAPSQETIDEYVAMVRKKD